MAHEIVTELIAVPLLREGPLDVYSGVDRLAGRLWASCHRPTAKPPTAVVVVHPSSNFLGHYALGPLAQRGVAAVGMNTRYIGNDSALIVENCLLDVAAMIRYLRDGGYDKVVLVGNSGGGGLAALYQSQAEQPTITQTPAGDPPDLTSVELPAVDALVMLMAHPGRASTLTSWLDPAIADETNPFTRDRSLDLFDPAREPPYAADFLARYREAQTARNRRITSWVRERLEQLTVNRRGRHQAHDMPFVVHGTCADPRFLDLTIDPSDRQTGTLWGHPEEANLLPVTLAHFSSLRSWLSQWSLDDTNLDGPRHLANVTVPTLVISGTADKAAFPSDARSMYDAVPHARRELVEIPGADHYFAGQPDLLELACDQAVSWLHDQGAL